MSIRTISYRYGDLEVAEQGVQDDHPIPREGERVRICHPDGSTQEFKVMIVTWVVQSGPKPTRVIIDLDYRGDV